MIKKTDLSLSNLHISEDMPKDTIIVEGHKELTAKNYLKSANTQDISNLYEMDMWDELGNLKRI